MESNKMKVVYVITRRDKKSYWNRVGVAFVNNDGSLNVRLEALPVSGELQIRDYVPREENTGFGQPRDYAPHEESPGFGLGSERQPGNGASDLLAELG